MPARTGAQYLAGLRERKTEVWLRGERVTDVTTHPGLAGGARAIASLYDLQCDPGHREAMTLPVPRNRRHDRACPSSFPEPARTWSGGAR